jgi:hypothetical protein
MMVAMATTTLVAESGLSRNSFLVGLVGLGCSLSHAHGHGPEIVLGTLPSILSSE